MIGLRELNNFSIQGDVGIHAACFFLRLQGYDILKPENDNLDYDLVIKTNEGFKTVQVRTTYHKSKHGKYVVHLPVSGGNRTGKYTFKYLNPSVVDYLLVLTDDGSIYFIPTSVITSKKQLNLGEKYEEYKVFQITTVKPQPKVKEKSKNTLTCKSCGKPITKNSKSGLCFKCSCEEKRKVKRPPLNVLKEQIEEFGYVGTAKIYGVSDNAIRKWLKDIA